MRVKITAESHPKFYQSMALVIADVACGHPEKVAPELTIDSLFAEFLPEAEAALATLTTSQLEEFAFGDVEEILDLFLETNPHFKGIQVAHRMLDEIFIHYTS